MERISTSEDKIQDWKYLTNDLHVVVLVYHGYGVVPVCAVGLVQSLDAQLVGLEDALEAVVRLGGVHAGRGRRQTAETSQYGEQEVEDASVYPGEDHHVN